MRLCALLLVACSSAPPPQASALRVADTFGVDTGLCADDGDCDGAADAHDAAPGDGYADVVVRFSGRWQGGTTFAVWYGGPTGPDRVTVGPCDAEGADVVQGVGDVNADGYDDLALSWSALGSVWVLDGGPEGVGLAVEVAPAEAGGGFALAESVTRPLSPPPPSSTAAPAATCGCTTTRPAPLSLAVLLLCARARRRR